MRQFGAAAKRHLVLLLLLTVSFLSQAQPVTSAPSLMQEITQDVGAQDELRRVLGERYTRFEGNFEIAANPVRLKDGGIFLDGWRAGHPDTHAAALVLYDDGRVYVAYVERDGRRAKSWWGGSDAWRHPAILVWLQRFQQTDVERTNPRSHSAPTTFEGEAPSLAVQEELRKIAMSIWGDAAATWEMNADVGNLLVIVTDEIMQCSAAVGLVPKPTGGVPGWSYLAKNALQITNHITGLSRNRIYKICVTSAARNWRSAVHLASMGM